MDHDMLKSTAVILDGVYFRVEPYPYDSYVSRLDMNAPYTLKKGIAYRYETDITKGLYPYRGIADSDFNYSTAKIGLWLKKLNHKSYRLIVVRPRTMKEHEEYRIGREKDIIAAVMSYEWLPDQFMENNFSMSDSGTEVFMPPIHTDDDFLNMLMKIAIRKKSAPFEPYGKRLQALAVDKKAGTERSNAKNNARRGLKINRAMSAGKFMEYADAWQVEPAIILRDIPGAMHKMGLPEGKMLVIYPNGIPFKVSSDNLIDVSDFVAQAIASPNNPTAETDDEEMEDEES